MSVPVLRLPQGLYILIFTLPPNKYILVCTFSYSPYRSISTYFLANFTQSKCSDCGTRLYAALLAVDTLIA